MTERFDPLRASTEIVDGYRRYLRALLPLRDPVLRAALDSAIDTSPLLSKGPLLEASPAYATGSTAWLTSVSQFPSSSASRLWFFSPNAAFSSGMPADCATSACPSVFNRHRHQSEVAARPRPVRGARVSVEAGRIECRRAGSRRRAIPLPPRRIESEGRPQRLRGVEYPSFTLRRQRTRGEPT